MAKDRVMAKRVIRSVVRLRMCLADEMVAVAAPDDDDKGYIYFEGNESGRPKNEWCTNNATGRLIHDT